MALLRRSMRIYPGAEQDVPQGYDALCEALGGHLARMFELPALEGWPNGQWDREGLRASCSEWRPESPSSNRLLHLELRQQTSAHELVIDLTLGCNGEEATLLFEEWEVTPHNHPLTITGLPDLYSCLRDFDCKNEDGLQPGRYYSVSAELVPALISFIESPTRRLPILLCSPADGASSYGPPPGLACAVAGMVHLIRLQDSAAAARFKTMLPTHPCYGGAMRLYWPGFDVTHRPGDHPFKSIWKIKQEGSKAIFQEYFDLLAGYSLRVFGQQDEIDALERAQDEAYREQQLLLKHQQAQQTHEVETYEQLYTASEAERHTLHQRVEELERVNRQLHDEIRQARWKVNTLWSTREASVAGTDAPNPLYLSRQAAQRLYAFDRAEQQYWKEHILPKLLDPQLRQRQSERVSGPLGSAWVYPRKRTGDGRRLFFSLLDDKIHVYELFHASEHDDRYSHARQNGIDPNLYTDFQPWAPWLAETREPYQIE
jgi:uncharacterized membrane protein